MTFEYFVNDSNTTGEEDAGINSDSFTVEPVAVVDTLALLIALLGVLSNFLCFQTATHLPEATSKYIVKYLAVWDTLAALEATLFYDLFFHYFRHLAANLQVMTSSLYRLVTPIHYLRGIFRMFRVQPASCLCGTQPPLYTTPPTTC